MNYRIPIFPLPLVVFPGSVYPLHIFEKRYKIMINDCLKNQKGFGIIAQFDKEFSKIGTYVIISSVLKKYDGGEMDIIVLGMERISVEDLILHKNGYYEAVANSFADDPNKVNSSLVTEVEQKFERLLNKIKYELDDAFWINYQKSKMKSFKLAEKAGLTLHQQQELLTLNNENRRLDYLLHHLIDLDKRMDENMAMQSVILGDGYINKS